MCPHPFHSTAGNLLPTLPPRWMRRLRCGNCTTHRARRSHSSASTGANVPAAPAAPGAAAPGEDGAVVTEARAPQLLAGPGKRTTSRTQVYRTACSLGLQSLCCGQPRAGHNSCTGGSAGKWIASPWAATRCNGRGLFGGGQETRFEALSTSFPQVFFALKFCFPFLPCFRRWFGREGRGWGCVWGGQL